MEISTELERTFSDSQRGRARYYYRLSVYANPAVWFLGLFLAANGQTALINTCVVNTPWMINVLRFAFLPYSGLNGYLFMHKQLNHNERAFNYHIYMNDK